MDTAILRSRILDLAIHGQLLPQNSADGSALDLLTAISQSRGQKITPVTDGVPFDLPESWCWVRLGNVSEDILYGVSESAKSEGSYKLLRITDIQNNHVNWDTVPFCNFDENKVSKYFLRKNDLVFARTGATVGKSYLISEDLDNVIFASYLIRVRLFSLCDSQYIIDFFNSRLYWDQISQKSLGIGQPNVNGTSLSNLVFPLPPLAEQRRIVAKVEELLAAVDTIESAQSDIASAASILQSRILDLAIHGSLTKQEPADGSALDLLAAINQERGQKITPVTDGVPFDLPESWCWVKLGEYLDVRDGTHDSPKYVEHGYPFVTSKNLVNGDIDFSTCKYIKQEDYDAFDKRSHVDDGDILYAMIGSIGNPVIVKKTCDFAIKNVALFKPRYSDTNMQYVYFWLLNKQHQYRLSATGGLQPFISLKMFRTTLIPLPPLAEQRRIVAKVESLFAAIDKLK